MRGEAEIRSLTGDGFDGEIVLVEVRLRPLYGSRITLRREDFLLRARNNNDTSPARSPERIAGSSVLDLDRKSTTSGGGLFSDPTSGGVWGGAPGTGTRPRRMPSPPGIGGVGIETAEEHSVEQRQESEGGVVGRLHRLELPLEANDLPVSGYLYFEIPTKIKRKHIELSYDGPLGTFLVEFKRPE